MQHPKTFHLLTALISSTFLCSSSLGDPSPSAQMGQQPLMSREAQMTQESQWIQAGEEPVSVQETFERTYMQNTDLDANRAGLRATDEQVPQAVGGWRPSVFVDGRQTQTQTYGIGRSSRNRADAHNSVTAYTATIEQNIYNGGGTEAAIGQAESNVLAGRAGLFVQEQTSLFQGLQAHTSILATEAIVEYNKQNRDFYLKLLERAQAFFDVGQGGRVEIEAARGKYEGGIADVATSIRDYENAKAGYMKIVGSPPGKLAPANVIVQLPKTYEEALEIAKTHNPNITQARYQLEAAEYNVYVQTAPLLPTVDINGTAGNDRQQGTGFTSGTGAPGALKRTNLGFGATVRVPIYSQGIPNARIRAAYQQVAQQKVLLVGAQRQTVEAVRTAWDNLIAARESVKGFLAQVKATELAVEGAFEEVNVGQKTVIEVIVVQQDLITAQINLATAQKNLVDAGYQLLQAMGRLTARDLKLNVRYYDPDTYYNEYKNAWIQFWQGRDWRYVKDGDQR
ncbi:MAG TPA: TolC family outer membrane protein [Alphaproteobacteria bacterium]|nr:TolC family outer membrane protein [Alphaproteobacteria bacterium]